MLVTREPGDDRSQTVWSQCWSLMCRHTSASEQRKVPKAAGARAAHPVQHSTPGRVEAGIPLQRLEVGGAEEQSGETSAGLSGGGGVSGSSGAAAGGRGAGGGQGRRRER